MATAAGAPRTAPIPFLDQRPQVRIAMAMGGESAGREREGER